MEDISPAEAAVLVRSVEPPEATRIDLRWNIECLWAAAWFGRLLDDLTLVEPVSGQFQPLFPQMKMGESGDGFLARYDLR